eukprot:Gregarina_sp_Poly_1__23@NODE_1004_length_5397_cov_173_232270_g704_i0_p3_GENE_NODE_1004_length_5397_cov_173_232270_g704_i0NODE_1004_length_5397_cov_173_232270_g704_i0_p3_ORF_typecomplete_len277_score24_02COPI_assoc/PF08507_10/1_2e16Ilm1/PF10311_9/20Ilm1/PF10311_9/3_5UPF0242/PF06785_11/1_1e03UPF0242/PF06785_11/0_23MukE/PF04288_13/0_21TMEM72/PF16054_5/1_7e02TMEM72/PF16054_5/0_51DUF2371/PF10177_9/6_6e02DUF2371/PF10177_9/7e03DUF2371/PF10177_9/1_6_NODE_1004_length_5397_cov_173_232270_g704_i030203850
MGKIHRPKVRAEVIHHEPLDVRYEEPLHYLGEDHCCSDAEFDIPLLIVRSLVAVAGVLLVFTGIYSLYPISTTITNIPVCALKFYAAFFGLTILLLEGKGALPEHSGLRKWFYTEFHFLHSIRGKGFYYLLVGMLSLALLSENLAFLICGIVISLMGVLDLILSIFTKRQLKERGLALEDLQTTTKVLSTSRSKSKRHEPLTQSAVASEVQRLIMDAQPPYAQEPYDPVVSYDPVELRTPGAGQHFGTPANNQLPEFEMTSYSDPLKIARIHDYGR